MNIEMNVDLPMLLMQKQALLRAIETARKADTDLLDGILSLLDHIHDTIDPPGKGWLDDENVALLRATGKLDDIESAEVKKAVAKMMLEGNIIPDVVIRDNRIGTPTDAELSANHKALREAFAAPLQSYSVTWRRPAAAYAHDEIEATSLEDAMMQAKTRVTSNRSDLYFDSDCDGMDTVDWISVEGNREHTEWELPKPSAGALMKALHDIRVLCESMSYQPGSALLEIDAVARKAIEASVPDHA